MSNVPLDPSPATAGTPPNPLEIQALRHKLVATEGALALGNAKLTARADPTAQAAAAVGDGVATPANTAASPGLAGDTVW